LPGNAVYVLPITTAGMVFFFSRYQMMWQLHLVVRIMDCGIQKSGQNMAIV